MNDKPSESWRARAAVSEALEVFNSSYMQEAWSKALARRKDDPEGAVTSARTLLESLCKHILDEAGEKYFHGLPLPKLYELTAKVLDIAPNQRTEPVFKKLFESCAEVVESVGVLRNYLSDAHGRGPFGTMPDWRHAELAVNLSGAMATYLAAVWKGRQPTVADRIHEYLANPPRRLGQSHRYRIEALAEGSLKKKVAAKLQVSDLVEFFEQRLKSGTKPKPVTLLHDFIALRVILGEGIEDVFEDAQVILQSHNYIGPPDVRTRRVTDEEYNALLSYCRERDKKPNAEILMEDVVEFAAWSGRMIGEICELPWSGVDFDEHTCEVASSGERFPVLERAWEIVLARRKQAKDDRIFPYYHRSVIAAASKAKRELSKSIPSLQDYQLNDFRFEAVNRLLERGHPPHVVAAASGMDVGKVVEIFNASKKATKTASPPPQTETDRVTAQITDGMAT